MKEEKNYKVVTDTQRLLKIWKTRNLIVERYIVICKIKWCQKTYCEQTWKKTKGFSWKNSTRNIKHETLCNDYKIGGFSCIKVDPAILFLYFLFPFFTNCVTIIWTQYILN